MPLVTASGETPDFEGIVLLTVSAPGFSVWRFPTPISSSWTPAVRLQSQLSSDQRQPTVYRRRAQPWQVAPSPASDPSSKPTLSPVLLPKRLEGREVPVPCSLGYIKLLEQLTELRDLTY